MVFKPADLLPGCAWALADILSRSGLPHGVFNLVMGRGSEIGQAILASTAAPNVNPNTRDIVGEYARGTRDDANRQCRLVLL